MFCDLQAKRVKEAKARKKTKPTLDRFGKPRCHHPKLKAFQGWLGNRVSWLVDDSEAVFGYVVRIKRSGRLVVRADDGSLWSIWTWQVHTNRSCFDWR